jgi:3-oxoacyl-[acyl-carrier-protein] synthase III
MSRRVAIAGVAVAQPAKGENVTPYHLIARSSREALASSGLTPADIDGLGSTGLGTLQPIDVAEYLGLRPRWLDSTSVGGAAWEVMASHAVDAIAEGRADVLLLTYGSTARSDLRNKLRTLTGVHAARSRGNRRTASA